MESDFQFLPTLEAIQQMPIIPVDEESDTSSSLLDRTLCPTCEVRGQTYAVGGWLIAHMFDPLDGPPEWISSENDRCLGVVIFRVENGEIVYGKSQSLREEQAIESWLDMTIHDLEIEKIRAGSTISQP